MSEVLASTRPLDGLRKTAVRFASDTRMRASAIWRAYPRETLGAGLLGLIGAAAVAATSSQWLPSAPVQPVAAPASPSPLAVRDIAPDQALKVNAAIPLAHGPNPAAAAFKFTGNAAARKQALTCLSSVVYYEAGNQGEEGERAVAQVVLNRVRHPAFPGSICNVVYEGSTRTTGCQFTFTCDGSLYRQPDVDGWKRAYRVAEQALSGAVYAPVGLATHYHADYVVPTWASEMVKSAVVGAHIFYRWNGGWGQPAIYAKAYAGREPDALALRTAALSVKHVTPVTTQGLAAAIAEIPGAEEIKLAPSMRGDKRVAVRFNLVGRKASDDVKHEAYVQKFEASDNLKWALSTASTAASEQPLGRAPATPPPAGGSTAQPPQP